MQQKIIVLKKRVDVLKYELDFYLNGVTIIARWEAMRECLLGGNMKWNLNDVDMQY